MTEAVAPVLMVVLKYVGASIVTSGSLVFVWWLSRITGKTSAQVRIGLDLQELNDKHVETINKLHEAEKLLFKNQITEIRESNSKEIKDLKNFFEHKIGKLIKTVENLQKDIKDKENDRKIWENDSMKKDIIIKNQNGIISIQEMELEKLR